MDVQPESIDLSLGAVDPRNPTRRDALGRAVCVVRCRVPVVLNAPGGAWRLRGAPAATPEQRAEGMTPDAGSVLDRIEGPASSTSEDWYRTRMVRECLEGMAVQFRAGIDYLPRHHTYSAAVEWDGVIGRTVDAQVTRAQVKNAPDGESPGEQYVLTVTTDLFAGEELAEKLVDRIQRGRPPGQSIGGWFTELQVTYDEDGCVMYPIDVLAVELDHLAAVRSPANPDADRVWLALSKELSAAGEVLWSARVPVQAAVPPGATTPPLVANTVPVVDFVGDRDIGETVSNRSIPSVTTSVPGTIAPTPGPATEGRSKQEYDMPLNDEDLARVADLVRGVVAPLQSRLDALATAQPAVATIDPLQAPAARAVPEPVPAPVVAVVQPDPEIAALRARLAATDAQLGALMADWQRRAAPPAAPAPGVTPAAGPVPEMWRARDGSDVRTIAPNACRTVARSGGEIELTPGLVLRQDGSKALAAMARASGEAHSVSTLLDQRSDLADDSAVRIGGSLRRTSVTPDALKSLLSDVILAGANDGIIQSLFSA